MLFLGTPAARVISILFSVAASSAYKDSGETTRMWPPALQRIYKVKDFVSQVSRYFYIDNNECRSNLSRHVSVSPFCCFVFVRFEICFFVDYVIIEVTILCIDIELAKVSLSICHSAYKLVPFFYLLLLCFPLWFSFVGF